MGSLQREEEEVGKAFREAHEHVFSLALGMVIKAAIELGVFDVMAIAGPGAELTAGEIAESMKLSGNEKVTSKLDFMLGFLASRSVVTCTSTAGDIEGRSEKLYGLAPMSRILAKSNDNPSLTHLFLLNFHKDLIDSWLYLKEAVQEGVTPFKRAHGSAMFEHMEKNPGLAALFDEAMKSQSNLLTENTADKYRDELMQINELVDVGGGTGATLSTIISKFPHIKGINFDLPRVIARAPPISGVEHVGGDMFNEIPRGGAILLKWILHNWDEERCLEILKNCWKALPTSGKVIIVEYILPETPETNFASREAYHFGMVMMISFDGAKVRTEKEFRSLASKTGFSEFKIVCRCLNYYIMELVK